MNKLDYGTQISFSPIRLSIGNIRKPTLGEIADSKKMGFEKFYFMEFLAKMTPEDYYNKLLKEENGADKWNSIPESEKDNLTIFDLIVADNQLRRFYLDLLNFYFEETVIYVDGYLIILQKGSENKPINELQQEDIKGLLDKEIFPEVLCIIQQICGIYSEEENVDSLKFKNEFQKNLYKKMLKAKKEAEAQKKNKGHDINMALPNIISTVANPRNSLNYTNIWELTVYQLLDSFGRLQKDEMYEINKTRVSVWGDKKKTFDFGLWYKNDYDKKT